jgi:hypothetical protein
LDVALLSLGAVGHGRIATVPGPPFVIRLLPAATAQLMVPVPPLSINRHLFNDDRARPGEKHGLYAVRPKS